jgi:gliding motility-associated-like protein
MKKIYKFLFIFLASLVGTILPSKATHMMGADVSYQCLGNGKYKIIAKVYRDCRGVPMGTPSFGAYAGLNGGNGCGSYTLSGLSRVSIKDVTTRCSTSNNPCGSPNTAYANKGVEEHTFEATVDFNTSPLNNFVNKSTCCEVTFYVAECCRNGAITTGQAGQSFYATAMVNLCNLQKMKNKCNSSPQLSNPPIAFLCCNQPWYYNNGATDTIDYDSISYKLVNGLQGIPNTSVSYSSPFTPRVPMTPYCVPPTTINCTPNTKTNPPRGFYFDTTSGDVAVTPTKCDESAVICVEQTEWRKDTSGVWRMIGKTRRDMQVWVRDDCGYNKAPTLGPKFSYQVCEGETLKFKVESDDETFTPYQTTPDTTTMKWNAGIPGAKFTLANKNDWPDKRKSYAWFEWTPPIGSASEVSYSFTVTVSDQHCEPPATSIRSFKIKVNPKPSSKRRYTQLKCGRFAMEAYQMVAAASYSWSVRDTLAKEIFYSSKKTDTMNYYYAGKYIIVHKLTSSQSCVTIYSDTVYLTQPPKVILADADSFACYGTSFTLKAKVLAGKPTLKYKWSTKSSDTLDNLTISNFKRDTTLIIQIIDGDGCKFSDTVLSRVKPLPVVDLGPNKVICTYESQLFDAQNKDTVKYLWSTGDTVKSIYANVKGNYWVRIQDKKYKCLKTDTVNLVVNDTVVANAGPNSSICHKDTFTINALHRPSSLTASYLWTGLGSNPSYRIKSDISKTPYTYILKATIVQNGHTCEDLDTVQIRVNPLPTIFWTSKPLKSQCYSYGNIWMEPFIVKPNKFGTYEIWNGDVNKKSGNITFSTIPPNGRFLFQTNQLDNSKLQGGNSYTTKMYVKFTDTNGCSNIDSTTQKISGTPLVSLIPKTFCQDLGSSSLDAFRKFPASKNGVFLNWEVVRAPSGVDTARILNKVTNKFLFGFPFEDYYQGKYTLRLTVRDIITGCQNSDTVDIQVIGEPNVSIKTIPDYCINSGSEINFFDYITVNGSRPVGGTIYIQDIDGDRNHPKVSTNISSGLLKASLGAGVYNIKYISSQLGCTKTDSFDVVIHDTSDLKVRDTAICSTSVPLDVIPLVTSNKGGTIVSYEDGRFFSGTPTSYGYKTGPYKWLLIGHTAYDCRDTEYIKITIMNQPSVKFVKPNSGCERDTLFLKIDTLNIKGGSFSWTQPSPTFGGNFDKRYIPTSFDTAAGYVDVKVTYTLTSPKVCSDVSDTIRIYLNKYPDIDFSLNNGCEPLINNFIPVEKKGINPAFLSYGWTTSTTTFSTNKGPTSYTFPNQGKYQVSLSVINTRGYKSCGTVLTKTVEVYPKPTSIFSTDPLYKTTVALPRFRTSNSSSASQNPFPTYLSYDWSWGKSYKIGSDTAKNPTIYFGKDTGAYWIKLITTTDKGCKDTSIKRVIIGPDIIIFIPDAFTPDNSGPLENNTFIPSITNQKTFRMIIFNRWGEKMYETKDLTKGWDGNYLGKPAPQGIYAYRVIVTSQDDKEFSFNGSFTLLR